MKLGFELVPEGCWYQNLRSALPPELWDVVRKDAYARANGRCMNCGKATARLQAHERWSYDEERCVQKLEDVVAVCAACHAVIHIGRTQLMGNEKAAIEHFMKVNGASYADYRRELGKANEEHARRNRISEWALDISWLKRYSQ